MERRGWHWSLPWLLLPLLAVFLGACGAKEEKSYVYVAEEIPVPIESNIQEGFKARDGYFYYCQGSKAYRFSVAELAEKKTELPEAEEVFAAGAEDGSICAYTLDGEGSGYYVLLDVSWRTGEVENSALVKQQPDGTEGYRLDLKELNIGSISSMAADGGGRVFLLTEELLCVVDEEGRLIARIPGSKLGAEFYGANSRLLEGEDGSVYYSPSNYVNMVYEVSGSDEAFRSGSFQMKRIEFPCTTGKCYSAQQGLLCAGRDDMLYRLRRGESEWETVLCYGDSNLQMQPFQMLQLSEEWMAAYYHDDYIDYGGYELYFLTKTDAALLPERDEKELVLATGWLTDELEKFIAEYNQTSGYHITVKYYQGSEGDARLNAELVSSNPPDLVDFTSVEAGILSEKGMLEDLDPYLEASSVLDREDFLKNLLDAYTLGGRLVGIPDSFTVETAVGRASQLGAQAGWTAEEAMAFIDVHPGARMFGNPTFTSIVSFFAEHILERYVDWESGECGFDGEEFRSFIRWMKGHSEGFGNAQPFTFEDIWSDKAISESQLLCPAASLTFSLSDLMRYELLFKEDITAIGYPTSDGRPYFTGMASGTVGIAVNSKNKEAAWQFLEAFLSREKRYDITGFPSRRDLLDKKVENMLTIKYEYDDYGEISLYKAGEHEGEPVMKSKGMFLIEGENVFYYYMTQEQMDTAMEVIENADFTPLYGSLRYQIISILLEELGPYIDGQKSLEEATDVLQRRVQNLVQENL